MYDSTLGCFLQRDPVGYVDGTNLYEFVGGRPTSEVDPTGRVWTRDQLLDNLKKCDGGTDIYAKALKANGPKDIKIEAGEATEVDLSLGIIFIKEDLNVCAATQSLIMELSNLSLKEDFLRVDSACSAGDLSRGQYIYDSEMIEYLGGVQNTIKAFKSCKEKWGCGTEKCRLSFGEPPPGTSVEDYFAQYYYEELSVAHKEHYGKYWDTQCKTAYDKKPGHAKGPGRPGRP